MVSGIDDGTSGDVMRLYIRVAPPPYFKFRFKTAPRSPARVTRVTLISRPSRLCDQSAGACEWRGDERRVVYDGRSGWLIFCRIFPLDTFTFVSHIEEIIRGNVNVKPVGCLERLKL